jgi:hypothetical protein
MLRSVSLPLEIRGALFLSSMPGEYESLEQAFQEMRGQGITRIVRLAPIEEIREKSPSTIEPWKKAESRGQLRNALCRTAEFQKIGAPS